MLGLTVFASTVSATVSLASFVPRIDNLLTQCATVYNYKIDGCVASDFSITSRCSATCVQGLVKITDAVLKSCADVDVGETSIIGVFQNGLGIQALCPGVTVTTGSSSTSTTTRVTSISSTQVAATTTAARTSTTSTTQSSAPQSSSTSSGGLNIDPSATASLTTSINASPTNVVQPGTSSTAKPSQVAGSQLSNSDSGGGSPFDVVAVGASSHLRTFDIGVTCIIATALLLVTCI